MQAQQQRRLLAVCLLLAALACGSSGSEDLNAAREAIERVLREDAATDDHEARFGAVAARVKRVDASSCPSDFRAAYAAHVHAWKALAKLERLALAHQQRVGRSGGRYDADGTALTNLAISQHLNQRYDWLTDRVNASYRRLEEIAARYGATVPAHPNWLSAPTPTE